MPGPYGNAIDPYATPDLSPSVPKPGAALPGSSIGTSSQRPVPTGNQSGRFYDITLGKTITWGGAANPHWFTLDGVQLPDYGGVVPPPVSYLYRTAFSVMASPGMPVDDFPVGLGALVAKAAIPYLGVMPYNGVVSITTAAQQSYTVTTDGNTRGKSYTFLIDRTKYPYAFCVGAQIGMELTADRNTYIAGTVDSTTAIIDANTISLVVNCPAGYAGVSGYGAPTGTGSVVTGKDWTLGTHTPPGTSADQYNRRLMMSYPQNAAQATYNDWDMSKMSTTLTAFYNPGTLNPSYPKRYWVNCIFPDIVNSAPYATSPLMDDVLPFDTSGCEGYWTWDRYAVYATVTAAPADGSSQSLTISIDALPTGRLPGNGGLVNVAIDINWRVLNVSNPRSMSAAIIKSTTSTSITVGGPVTDLGAYYSAVRTSGVKVGDRLAFFPQPNISMLFGAPFAGGRRNRITFVTDMIQSAPQALAGLKLTESVISFMPTNGHPDIYQAYGGGFGPLELGNNVVHWAWEPAQEAKLPGSWFGLWVEPPNDITQFGANSPVTFPMSFHDFTIVPPPNNLDANGQKIVTVDKLFSLAGPTSQPILGIRANAAGNARVSFDLPGGNSGYMAATGDTWIIGGTATAALNGPIVADFTKAAPGGVPIQRWTGNINAFTIALTAAAASGATTLSVASTDGGKVGIGTLLYSGSTSLGYITAVSSDNLTITIDTALASGLASGASIIVKAWIDTTVPYSGTEVVAAPGTTIAGSGVSVSEGQQKITVNSTAGFRAGMVITSTGYKLDTTILSIDDGTHMTLSHGANLATIAAGGTLNASMCWKPGVTGATSIKNLNIRGASGLSSVMFSGYPLLANLTASGIIDIDTGAPLVFSYIRSDGTTVTGATSI